MTLDEYRRTEDSNAFWRLRSGERQALLDEAIEQIEQYEAALANSPFEIMRCADCEKPTVGTSNTDGMTRCLQCVHKSG